MLPNNNTPKGSVVQEHAPDILNLALWSLVAVGSALLATLVYIWSKLDKRLDAQDSQMG